MESSTLPTVEEFFSYKTEEEYSRQFHNKVIVNISVDKYKEWAHEYAVLFAKWHVKQALESANNEAKILLVQSGKDDESKYEYVFRDDLLEEVVVIVDPHSILNAYKEGNIK